MNHEAPDCEPRNFNYLTAIAVATSITLFGVLVIGDRRQRSNDENRIQAVDRDDTEKGQEAVEDRGAGQDANRGQAGGGAAGQLQPCTGDAAAARRGSHARRLFDAIRTIESGGNDYATGDSGLAHGPYQAHLGAWLDGGGKASDYPRLAYRRVATENIMLAYWRRYGAVTDRDKAVCWNVGPRWRTRARVSGEIYWQKVKSALDSQ